MAFLPLTLTLALVWSVGAQSNDAPVYAALDTNILAQIPVKPVKSMSLQDCIQQALQHNLDLQIERTKPKISLYGLRSDYGVFDPTLSAAAGYAYSEERGRLDTNGAFGPAIIGNTESVSAGLGGLLPWGMTYRFAGDLNNRYGSANSGNYDATDGAVSGRLTQSLLRGAWTDPSRLTIALSKRNLRISEAELRLKMMEVITDVESAYYDLIAAQETVKVQEKAMELANQLLAENKKRVEVGALAPLDEKQAESRVATARADLLTARQTLAAAQNALKSMLTDNYRDLYEIDIQPVENLAAPVQVLNVQESWARGMNQRPDLLSAKLAVEKQGIQLKYDRNQIFPQLDVYGSYGYGAGGAGTVTYSDGFSDFRRGDQPFYTYGATFSIPLSLQGPRNRFKSSKATLQQLLLSLKQLEQLILTQIDNDIIGARVGYERVDATREARIYAEAALEAEQKKLESGKSTSFIVLELQRDLTGARSQEIQALADYNKALATLARDEGSTLERRSVDIRTK